ncbi:MAG: GNAT family N-acetyltransferase [Thermoleophilia bacterium]
MARTRDLDEGALAAIRALVDLAFAGDFDDHDWAHALGGVHALIEIDGATVGHASVVPRSFWLDDQPLRCGYVEAVAVHPHHRRRGLGWRLMGAMEALIAGTDDLGALSASEAGAALYARRGWLPWRGPLGCRTDLGVMPSRGDEGVFVFPVGAPPDPRARLVCDWRPGDVW